MTTDISVGVRWDPLNGQPDGNNGQIEDYDFEYDGGNSSSRLFERSRIRALAGEFIQIIFYKNSLKVIHWYDDLSLYFDVAYFQKYYIGI